MGKHHQTAAFHTELVLLFHNHMTSDNPFITHDDPKVVSAVLSTTNGFICASCSAALPGTQKTLWLYYSIQLHQLKVTAGSSVLRSITRILSASENELADGNWWHYGIISGGLKNCIECRAPKFSKMCLFLLPTLLLPTVKHLNLKQKVILQSAL